MTTSDDAEARRYQGGCLCGAVRYEARGKPLWVTFCHCRSCRRATGAPVTAYAGFPTDQGRFTTGRPANYHSSPGVTRTFCAVCGTPLTFEGERWPGEIHFHLGTLDDPNSLPPDGEAFADERLDWVHLGKS